MKLAALLIPACLFAQSPDQGLRDRLKALSQVPAPPLSIEATAQFDVREFFSKSHVHSESNESLQLMMDGARASATRKGPGPPITWTRPVEVNPGDEDPSEPGKLEAWLHPYRLDALLVPAKSLLGIVESAKWKASKETVFEGEIAKQHTYVFKTRVPKKFDFYAIDRESTLVLTTAKDDQPLLAELTTGYRGRVGRRGDTFGRRIRARWIFKIVSKTLTTRSYDLHENHTASWTTTEVLVGIKARPSDLVMAR